MKRPNEEQHCTLPSLSQKKRKIDSPELRLQNQISKWMMQDSSKTILEQLFNQEQENKVRNTLFDVRSILSQCLVQTDLRSSQIINQIIDDLIDHTRLVFDIRRTCKKLSANLKYVEPRPIF